MSQTPYIENDVADKFETSLMKKDPNKRYSYYEFLGYHTFQNSESGRVTDSTTTNLGLITPGEHLENETITGNALFGNSDDVCIINYSVQLQRKYVGRSALLSILNLFAKEKDQKPQQPYDVLQAVHVNGTMRTGERITTFNFERKQKSPLKGWLCYNDDTLFLQKVKIAHNANGESRKAKKSLQLENRDSILAAIDFLHEPYTIYMLKGIDNNKRLIAASYFFVFTAYNYYLGTDPSEQIRERDE